MTILIFSNSKTEMVLGEPFKKPLHRLIMLHVLHAGAVNGEGERIIANDDICSFCCCTEATLFKESRVLERKGYLLVRKITEVSSELKIKEKEIRGYTILAPSQRGK